MMYELTIITKKDTYHFDASDWDFDDEMGLLRLFDQDGSLIGVVTGVKAFFAKEIKSERE